MPHDAVSALRMILRFGFAVGFDECKTLLDRLAMLRFERPGAREEEMTYAHASAFVRESIELGVAGVIPADRAKWMAIGVAAQFELALRQKDVIGEWAPTRPKVPGAVYAGAEMWTGHFYWENIPGWRPRLKTSKNRARAEFYLGDYPLLFPLWKQCRTPSAPAPW